MKKKKEKILLLGYLGYLNNQIDGQTIKTRLVKEILEEKFNDINYLDTQNMKRNYFFIFKIIESVIKNKKIIIMPGKNGLRIIFPIIFLLSKILKNDIYYIVIGGWLEEFIRNRTLLKYMLKKIKGIYIEIPEVKIKLEGLRFKNIKILYNFRKIDKLKKEIIDKSKTKELKLVFFSRITKEKGILDLLEALYELKNKEIKLDIYGPIDTTFEIEFYNNLKKNPSVEYKGVLKTEKENILSQYDLMVFPTYYNGEGLAGVIIESYIANLPILASNWKYNNNFVIDKKTGLLYETRDIKDLQSKILYFYKNKKILLEMRKNIEIELEKYSYEVAKENIYYEII